MKTYLGPSPNKESLFNFGAVLIFLELHSTNIDCKAQGAKVFFFNLVIFFLALRGYFRRIRLSMVNSNNSIKILYCYVGMLVLFMNFVQQFFVMSLQLQENPVSLLAYHVYNQMVYRYVKLKVV